MKDMDREANKIYDKLGALPGEQVSAMKLDLEDWILLYKVFLY